jgi:uncharacterized protein YgiM (DUF1202 family)
MRRLGVGNRVGIALIAVLLAVMGVSTGWSATPVSAQDEVTAAAITPGTNAVVANGPLNMRSTASTSGSIITVLATGTVVAVNSGPTSANGYTWWNVTASGSTGYVAGEFLAEVGFVVGDDVAINSNDVNVRSGAGTSFSVIDQLNTGALAEVIGGPTTANGYVWYRIQYEVSLTGWVAGLYLTLSNTPPPGGGFGINSWIMVDDPPVNLRSGAGTSFSIIGTLANNQGVRVTGAPTSANGFTWYPVQTLNATNGWVAGTYFAGGIFLNDYGIVADGPLNLRATASSSGNILLTMPTNASIFINNVTPVFAGGQTWFNVTYNGTTGWAAGTYLGDA